MVVFDIDGVVADVRHRLHFLDDKPKNWAGFFAAAPADPALAEGLSFAQSVAHDHEIVWLTGRPESMRNQTMNWLRDQRLPVHQLIMRRRGDHRPARIVKLDALRVLAASEIELLVDDDPDVINAAAEAGFPTRLAEWVPRKSSLAAAQGRLGRT